MASGFYRSFEDRFRGTRELIRSRLKAYLPFVTPLQEAFDNPVRAIDLGCGRGEWLELLQREGFAVEGVDLDDHMLEGCTQLGLHAKKADALEFIAILPDASVGVITAFHVVEHIPFDALQKLVEEALRALIPGGLLIMETPNPENLEVGAHTFYMDPTHRRPIPPRLLSFIPEYFGFERVKTLRLQEPSSLHDAETVRLVDVLCNVSPDYAVIAQKKGEADLLAKFDDAFSRSFGVTLEQLAEKHDAQDVEIRASMDAAEKSAANATQLLLQMNSVLEDLRSNVVDQAQHAARDAESTIRQERAEAAQLRAANAALQAQLHHLAQAHEEHVSAMLRSTSWRVTAPLRAVKDSVASLVSAAKGLRKKSGSAASRSTGTLQARTRAGTPRFSEAPTKRSVEEIIVRTNHEVRASSSDQARR